ncbi:hypothetical protein KUTeg_010038 [Tegillarca granosa]|uniref:TLC domain-containing protein n=1 Tax=Tegillarca granosa TaxID=220873 RepID=A0ABQ9F5L8_TEGGR|nr:hypothetical protein KUTeg_010038 [Tegillarca granosa]
MEGVLTFGLGSVYFTSIFSASRRFLEKSFGHKLSTGVICSISVEFVAFLQGLVSFIVGMYIAHSCQGNIMTDRHWLTNTYACFAMPYFYYDTWAKYMSYWHSHPQFHSKGHYYGIKKFVLQDKAMMIHHIVLPNAIFPVIIFFRKGIGDYFVGLFYQVELAVPFIAIRNVLVQHTSAYIICGLCMIVTFAISRVFIFPYLYWKYAQFANISVWRVPSAIPIKCNIGCLSILVLQIYWLCLMVRGAFRVFYKIYQRRFTD